MCFKHRKQKLMRKSGVIAVFIKDNLFKYFSHVESECEYVFEQAKRALFITLLTDTKFGFTY